MNKYCIAFISFLTFEAACPGQEAPPLPDYPTLPTLNASVNNNNVGQLYAPVRNEKEALTNSPEQFRSHISLGIPFIGQPKGVWPPRFESELGMGASFASVSMAAPSAPVQSAPVQSAPVPVPAVPSIPAIPDMGTAAPVAPGSPAPTAESTPTTTPVAPAVPAAPPAVQDTQAAQPSEPIAAQALRSNDNSAQTTNPVPPQRLSTPTARPAASAIPLAVDINSAICPLKIRQARQGEHPMGPLREWATASRKIYLSRVRDYTCIMIKKERQGKSMEPNKIFMKVKEQPYSVYMRFEEPKARAGQEALYVHGQNNNKLLGHDVGFKKYLGSMWLDPAGTIAMMGQRYPITDSGIANLVSKMIETMTNDMRYGECSIHFTQNGPQIDGRPCIRIDVIHPVKRDCFRFHKAEIYLDKQLGIPLRYAAYIWPEQPGGTPVLDEEYTFTNIKFNVGLTDADFSKDNKEYKF